MLDIVLGRIIAPTGAVGFVLFAEERGWGLFNLVEPKQLQSHQR